MRPTSAVPYARMIGNKFDVSAYCQDSLVTSLDHLSSVKFAVFSLIRPALKIAARSFFIEREQITFSNLLSQLNDDRPITPQPSAAREKRPFFHRLIYFLCVGIPLALFVGFLAGFIHLIKTIFNDVITVFTVVKRIYSMSQKDIKFYRENPESLPPRKVLIDGIINSGLHFYTRRLIDHKLGIFSFMAKPFVSLLAMILTNRVVKIFDQIDRARAHYRARRAQAQQQRDSPQRTSTHLE